MLTISPSEFAFNRRRLGTILKRIGAELELPGRVTVKLASVEESRWLNKRFLKKNYATDVLSFHCGEELVDGFYLGDIMICYPIAHDQAANRRHSIDKELLTLVVHGMLHLLGWDHERDNGEMVALQQRILDRHWGKKR